MTPRRKNDADQPPRDYFEYLKGRIADVHVSSVARVSSFARAALPICCAAALVVGPRVDLTARRAAPAMGDVIFNEYAADNDPNDNDFFELLVLGDRVDLRGLRVSDNELVRGAFNNGETVFVFGNDAFLSAVPRGTVIAVWTSRTGVTPDTVVNPAAGDWKMVLVPGTGVAAGVDGLGGAINPGLANGGDALYLYLAGPNGNSTGADNVYLDFVSWEDDDEAVQPTGFADLNLASVADNAYYSGTTAQGNDAASNWVRYDSGPTVKPTAGEANPKQDLSALRRR
jgi:hypothetical protein